MFKKPNRDVWKVFLHHSATDITHHDNPEFIREIHVDQNGWNDIGYHYFITNNGKIHECRDLEKTPAAQKNRNTGSIAICLSGSNFFSDKQKNSLVKLCKEIHTAYADQNITVTFHGHKEVAKTECPRYDYPAWLHLTDKGRMQPFAQELDPWWVRLINWIKGKPT